MVDRSRESIEPECVTPPPPRARRRRREERADRPPPRRSHVATGGAALVSLVAVGGALVFVASRPSVLMVSTGPSAPALAQGPPVVIVQGAGPSYPVPGPPRSTLPLQPAEPPSQPRLVRDDEPDPAAEEGEYDEELPDPPPRRSRRAERDAHLGEEVEHPQEATAPRAPARPGRTPYDTLYVQESDSDLRRIQEMWNGGAPPGVAPIPASDPSVLITTAYGQERPSPGTAQGWISDDPHQQCCRCTEPLLRVANIVFNEAGVSSDAAKTAIAYAWLNRTRGSKAVMPTATVISDYVSFRNRVAELDPAHRAPFIRGFAASLEAACVRFCDTDPKKNDPTEGATHWVSPRSLPVPVDEKCGAGRTLKDNVCYPNWTRPKYEPDVEEIVVPGVSKKDFRFYKGVRYKL